MWRAESGHGRGGIGASVLVDEGSAVDALARCLDLVYDDVHRSPKA